MKILGLTTKPLLVGVLLGTTLGLFTASQIPRPTENTSEENTSGHLESLQVKVGELEVKVTGENITAALMKYVPMFACTESLPFNDV